jgi:hypothetical protein
MRPTATLLLLALAAWLAILAAVGAAAMGAFGSLPHQGISVAGVEGFFAGSTEEMGRYAAGRMMQPLFALADWVQFGASALTVGCTVRLARLGGFRGPSWARGGLYAAVGAAAVLLAIRAWTAPGMDADLHAYWEAAQAGDHAAADAARASFDVAHRAADGGMKAQLVAVGAALVLLTWALVPAPAAAAPRRPAPSVIRHG